MENVGLSPDVSEWTSPYRPFRLILCEAYTTRAEARKREVYLKSGIGKEFLKAIVSTM
jgi:putative endonuclease